MVNVDRAAWLVGREAAEELDRQGLIRHDAWQAPKPTHWLVRVTPGTGPYTHPRGCRKEIEDVWRTVSGSPKIRYYSGLPAMHAELTYKMPGPAKTQVTRALNCGLAAELIPCILMPVNNIG